MSRVCKLGLAGSLMGLPAQLLQLPASAQCLHRSKHPIQTAAAAVVHLEQALVEAPGHGAQVLQ